MTIVDNAMGFFGFIYIILTFFGVLFQIKYVCGNKENLVNTYTDKVNNIGNKIRNDINDLIK